MSTPEARARELVHGLVTSYRAKMATTFSVSDDDDGTAEEVLAAAVDYACRRLAEMLFVLGEYHPQGQDVADRFWQQVALDDLPDPP